MRRLPVLVLSACVIAALASASQPVHSASATPDFSGSWTLVSVPGDSSGPLGREGSIVQDGSRLTFSGGIQPLSVRLDGQESESRTASGWTLASQARWVTNALLITTKYNTPIGHWEDMVVCSLDSAGSLNVVAVSTPKFPEHAMATKQFIYRKKSS